jgi:lipoprotein-anchoring transpeptidase ErfK/SrfK
MLKGKLERVLTGRTLATLAGAVLVLASAAAAQAQPGLNPDVPKIGQRRVVVSRRIVVSIPDRKLALLENDAVVKTYNVSVGAAVSPSRTGTFQIVNRIPKAAYYHKAVVIPASDRSPIGTRWIGLNKKGYGIHGTNEPRSIGRAASHGCIRLGNRDAEDFFERVQVGDAVEIRGERDAETAVLFGDSAKVTLALANTSSMNAGQ